MAAEMVIWDNLQRTLDSPKVALLLPFKEQLDKLRDLVRTGQGVAVALDGRDHINGSLRNLETYQDQSGDLSGHLRHGRLKNLSNLLYQVDDLLDKTLTFDQRTRLCRGEREGTGRESRNQLVRNVANAMSRSTQEVSIFLTSSKQITFTKKMVGRIEKVRNDIETLVGQLMNEFDSSNLPGERPFQHIEFESVQDKVTGRNDEKKNIINMLLQPARDSKCNVSVVCVSGLPGVGKSALAKDIYEDYKVKSHFDLRMWIPVSQITDEIELIREIVEACTNRRSNYHNFLDNQNDRNSFRDLLGCRSSSISTSLTDDSDHQDEIDIYERRLRKEIKGKLYLLILDDVCLQKWQRLKNVLAAGARGSQILVTTGLAEVVDLVKRETPEAKAYPLEGLTKQHSWALFKRLTLKQDHSYGFSDEDEMRKTGFEIVDMCKHVPLTVKVAARFLHGKTKDDWLTFEEGLRLIRDRKEDVMEHVLHLSYSELTIRLRACFGYCSLFPNGYMFNKHDLISLWIAQGFVNPLNDPSLEETGEKYFMELSRRCLFEQVSTDELGNTLTCKMHHIVSSLAAKFTAGVSNIHMTDSGMIQVPDPTSKHVSVNCRGYSSLRFSSTLLQSLSLRTLIFVKEPYCDIKVDKLVFNQLISSYKRLRVLHLQDIGLKKLPESIGEQIHLRYLDLSKNDGLVTLPKSITRLYNLQTLKLNSCPKLKTLAADFGLLVNLKRFEVDECDGLTWMPLGLEKLTQLETLSRFVVGKGCSKQTAFVGLKTLSGLTMLRGRLAIEMKGDWMTINIPEVKQALCTKENLVEVKISWPKRTSTVQVSLENEILVHGEILENLKPNSNLKILCIEGYKGNDFPSWANIEMMSSLPNLVIISIEGCGKCRFLPPFGELPLLRKLTLRHMANVQYAEDAASLESPVDGIQEPVQDRPFFQSLQELTLHNFYSLEGWRQEVAWIEGAKIRSFPSLCKLSIWNCPKLTSFPLFTEVIDLNLQNINHLLLEECARKASRIRNNSHIIRLQIKGCLNLDSLRAVRNGLGGQLSLKHLVIDSCDAFISLATDIGQIPSLEKLEISNCKELDLSKDSNIPIRVTNVAYRIPRSPWKNLKSLRELKLREIPKMETLPDGLKHVRTLKTLCIAACQSLGSLPEWISSLTALQHLRIENCRALKKLPEGLKDVRSLMKVQITECPELMQRCREPKGEDWPKIKHARVLLHKSRRYGYV